MLGRKEDAEGKRKEIAEKFMGCMRARESQHTMGSLNCIYRHPLRGPFLNGCNWRLLWFGP